MELDIKKFQSLNIDLVRLSVEVAVYDMSMINDASMTVI